MTLTCLLPQIIMTIDVGWESIFGKIQQLFLGGNYTDPGGITHPFYGVIGDPVVLGAIIFIFFFLLTAVWGLGILIGSVVIIPASFAVFQYIPQFQIVVAIICGLVFGMGLNRLIRR